MDYTKFLNDRYKLLFYLNGKEIPFRNTMIIKTSQDEMAKDLHLSKHKINQLVKDLIELKVLTTYDSRGKYQVTVLGKKVIYSFEMMWEEYNDEI